MVIKNKRQKNKFFSYNFLKKNCKAWTSVIEVFVSILLIAGIMTAVVNSNAIQKPKISEQIYKEQAQILKVIQMNNELRGKVIGGSLIKDDINNLIPENLECETKICNFGDECNLETITDKEIYVKSVLITTDGSEYNARELKLFCWEK